MVGSPARQQLWAWFYATNLGCIVNEAQFWVPLHFWSLAIEEHFYLIWPFVIWRCGRDEAIRVCVACILLTAVNRELMIVANVASYKIWLLDTSHLDSLALGGLIALLARVPQGSTPLVRPARYVAAISALALGIVVSLLRGMDHMSLKFQAFGMLPLVILFGAAIILVAHAPRSSLQGILFNSGFMRFFGKYSYGIYVWHGLLMGFFNFFWFPTSHYVAARGSYTQAVFLHGALSSLVSVVIAVISYQLFEKHFLKLKRFFDHRSLAVPARGAIPRPHQAALGRDTSSAHPL
jgi:peptidoglycan/LPS O-acetylase OafA/YrhL